MHSAARAHPLTIRDFGLPAQGIEVPPSLPSEEHFDAEERIDPYLSFNSGVMTMTNSPLTVRLATALRSLAAQTDIENPAVAWQPRGPLADEVRAVLAAYDAVPVSHVLVNGSAEHATVLAALRYYELQGQGEPHNRSDEIHRLATRDGEVMSSLDDSGIRELRTRLASGLEDTPHCSGCGRDEADCSADPCASVIADREEAHE